MSQFFKLHFLFNTYFNKFVFVLGTFYAILTICIGLAVVGHSDAVPGQAGKNTNALS